MNERAQVPARRGREQERREVKYQVRAKTGPGPRDWNQLGVAFERRNGEGLVIKLNTLPIDRNWNGQLVLVPPYVDEDDYDPTTGESPISTRSTS
ncbi:MAG: hypothetical protein KIT43_06045 [Bauldia sp.]|nr:hypothetical protein [Bauldia sp.]